MPTPTLFQWMFGRIKFSWFFRIFRRGSGESIQIFFNDQKIESLHKKLRGFRKNWEPSEKLRENKKCSQLIENLILTDQLLNSLQNTLLINMIFTKHVTTKFTCNIKLDPYLCKWIDCLFHESKLWVCTSTDDPGLFLAEYNERTWQMMYNGVSFPECECIETSGTGFPCCHLIALFKQLWNDTFPVHLIVPRWITNFERFAVPGLPQLTLEQSDFIQKILS
jgi:hypothetical protein